MVKQGMSQVDEDKLRFDNECYYWDVRVKTCRANASGLFLPAAEHIATYCVTESHPLCPYYHDFMAQQADEAAAKQADDRRRYSRVTGKYPFLINALSAGLQDNRPVHVQASTIDFSMGGVRFETDQLLPVDALVEFTMAGSYSNLITSGAALVKWCKARKASRFYHVGVSFVDKGAVDIFRSDFNLEHS